jgi:hypothetical protein
MKGICYVLNLVDVNRYCNCLSELTNVDYEAVTTLVLNNLASVADGLVSITQANLEIENELLKLMDEEENLVENRTTNINKRELAIS